MPAAGQVAAMPIPRRSLPVRQDIPWTELRRRSAIVFLWLQAGWTALSPDEREEVRRLLVEVPRAAEPALARRGAPARRAGGQGGERRRRPRPPPRALSRSDRQVRPGSERRRYRSTGYG